MTSRQIRQSFLDFFKSKQHTIVPSSSLLPDSPNLLFTNAGMNQFVPIFLGQQKCPYNPPRAADTQKCIRAGGKHNDLEDVGLDTYHHTFFEMLGNWSFGDYFKKEAIEWAWELVTEVWKFPKHRLYATVYKPDKSKGDPSDLDQEAFDFWAEKFRAVGLDPNVHIVFGNKKDNFWMMGETGPCGPCSEIHVDLTPAGDTKGSLVNQGSAECIEIWNLVFIQFNANPDGTFSPLPARHVDTGMGFERVTGIIQNTKDFTDFSRIISNYETDIFRPIFDRLEQLSGKRYGSTLPKPGSTGETDQEKIDIAFRVIADHIRTLSFAIADGIEPGNKERNSVLRRILRRAVRYGRTLGFHEPFFFHLADVVSTSMGDIFSAVREKKDRVAEVLRREEESFNETLDSGVELFEQVVSFCQDIRAAAREVRIGLQQIHAGNPNFYKGEEGGLWRPIRQLVEPAQKFGSRAQRLFVSRALAIRSTLDQGRIIQPTSSPIPTVSSGETLRELETSLDLLERDETVLPGEAAFLLSDTYGFPVDLTKLMARERGMTVDVSRYNELLEEQKKRSQEGRVKETITLSDAATSLRSRFVGYEELEISTSVAETLREKGKAAVILDVSPCYAEMGGQVGDKAEIVSGSNIWCVSDTKKNGDAFIHWLATEDAPDRGAAVRVRVDPVHRNAVQRHHTVTHLLHWALHEVVSREASQKGSYVGPEKLTFDFNCAPLTRQQVLDVEKLVNERIVENAGVSWIELPYTDVKPRKDIMQFFGDKYGDIVRVVQIGGKTGELNGYSMELCGGTHTRATGEIGLFRIVSESAIAAGVRRIEAVAGGVACEQARKQLELIESIAAKVNSPVGELEKKIESLLAHQKELEKQLKAGQQKQAAEFARSLKAKAQTIGATNAIIENLGDVDGDFLQAVLDALRSDFKGVALLAGASNGAAALVAGVSSDLTKQFQAGKIIQTIAPIVGGKGGGRPDFARGGGKDPSKIDEALAKARELIAG